jgi:hypothetical protein
VTGPDPGPEQYRGGYRQLLTPVPSGIRDVEELPPVAAAVAVLADGSGHRRVWRSILGSRVWLLGPTPGGDQDEFRDAGGDLAGGDRWPAARVAAALASADHLGELAAGIVLGATGSGRLQADNETFTFLADIGFALIMFVVGAQVPVRDHRLRVDSLGLGGRAGVAGRVAGSA